jgi:hypothetical protein
MLLALNAGATVTNNTVAVGGGISNSGTLTLNPDSRVTGNDPDDRASTWSGTGCPGWATAAWPARRQARS